MWLCDNDLLQLKEIKKVTVETYLILLGRKAQEQKDKAKDNGTR
jgi:hypothetical protein